jgi:tetratricopeptide (TPR) repeat protein
MNLKLTLLILFSILILALIPAGMKAVPVTDSLFARGNDYYMQRQYSMAEQCYTRIVHLGYESGELYFNLGNALYKQDKIAAAILYYEKALLLNPGDEDINENLALANARIVDKINAIPEFFVTRWVNSLRGLFSPDTWAVISLAMFLIGLAGLLIYYVSSSNGLRKVSVNAGFVLLGLALLSLVLMITRIRDIQRHDNAIIMSSSVTARSSPDEQSTNVFVLHEGTKVSITDSVQNWKEIRIADGNTGWIPGEALEEI